MSCCFVMLAHPDGSPHPVLADVESGTVKVFDSFAEAEAAMDIHAAALAWGYEIYPWPARAVVIPLKRFEGEGSDSRTKGGRLPDQRSG